MTNSEKIVHSFDSKKEVWSDWASHSRHDTKEAAEAALKIAKANQREGQDFRVYKKRGAWYVEFRYLIPEHLIPEEE